MDNLPLELINRIVFYLERYEGQSEHPILLQWSSSPSKLPPIATISKSWKEAIELVTFHKLQIKSDELRQFRNTLTGNRRRYLTALSVKILLPEYSEKACGFAESDEEQQLNNATFTQGIRNIFSILKEWEDEGLQTALRLEFPYGTAFSQTDLRLENKSQLQLEIAQHIRGKDIFERRFEKSFLQLVEPETLPKLSNVSQLNIRANPWRRLAPTVGPDLAASLPKLKEISWEFGDCDEQTVGTDNRVTFSEALIHAKLQKRSTAEITFYHENPFDQRSSGRSLIPPGLSYDPFSAGLRVFSQNLTSLTLSAHLSSSVFWPSGDETNSQAPTWPFLQKLNVTFDMVAPSGEWYFTGTGTTPYHEDDNPAKGIVGGDSENNYTNYREHGDVATINVLIYALAKAVQNMPILEHFLLTSELASDKGHFQISYHAPNRSAEWGDESDEDLRVRRIYYEVGEVWRPDDEIATGLRTAGREKYGEEVIERFLASQW